ncbi:hypothetical protein GQ600_8859 [Phytophthora cactorum]|nr:hypothetical protein GQ600_8859 [Phytophthora cactorum]
MTSVWLEMTEVWSFLAENLMRKMRVERVLRIGHSVKFYKKFKVRTGSGQREIMCNTKMLLLAQSRRLTWSENNDETEALLRYTQPSITQNKTDPDGVFRKMVKEVFGEQVSVKQNPFHVLQRISEKSMSHRKSTCKRT